VARSIEMMLHGAGSGGVPGCANGSAIPSAA
jgi:hypothetical protein